MKWFEISCIWRYSESYPWSIYTLILHIVHNMSCPWLIEYITFIIHGFTEILGKYRESSRRPRAPIKVEKLNEQLRNNWAVLDFMDGFALRT